MITLQYQSQSITIRSPILGNREIVSIGLKYAHAMDGSIFTYIQLPQKRRQVTVQNLNRPQTVQVEEFIKFAMGRTINYTDWNAITRQVKILTNPFTTTHDARRNNSFTLEMEDA